MAWMCPHFPEDMTPPAITTDGCSACIDLGQGWTELRFCQDCGLVGCCDESPGKHATAHFHEAGHPLIRSFEQGEGWWYCYVHGIAGDVEGAPPAPSRP